MSMVAIIDIRHQAAFEKGHITGAVNIPLADWHALQHELPKADVPLVIVDDADRRQAWPAALTDHAKLEFKRLDPAVIAQLIAEGRWAQGAQQGRFWQPSQIVGQLLAEQYGPVPSGRAIDLACGAGRDALALAMAHWQVLAVDHSSEALDRVKRSAERHHLDIQTQQFDLERADFNWPSPWLDAFDLVNVSRYLHRPLLARLPELLRENGLLVYQTFAKGAERVGAERPRNPNYLLQADELRTQYSDLAMIESGQYTLQDGRPIQYWIGRR